MPSRMEARPTRSSVSRSTKLIGKDYTTPDLYAKVTGKSKYAEDFRAEGMLFCKLLLSPVPHGRVKHLDLSKALAMPGVKAILTQDDLPAPADSVTDLGAVIKANQQGEKALTMEPLYQGEPILAVAAVDELTAAEAIEKIDIEFEHLPFVVDPLDSLAPRRAESPYRRQRLGQAASAACQAGRETAQPSASSGRRTEMDGVGLRRVEARPPAHGQTARRVVLRRCGCWVSRMPRWFWTKPLSRRTRSHQTLEPRTALAYWQNGKVFIHMGTQSTVQTLAGLGRWLNMDPNQIVLISEYTGGGFGSKATGYIFAIIPALLAKKANAPVMMRISREEEHFIGRARPGFQGRMKVGFSKDGQDHGVGHVRHLQQRSLRREWRCQCVRNHRVVAVSAARPCAGAA